MTDEDALWFALNCDPVQPDLLVGQLRAFEALVRKWNPAVNIVAKSTVQVLWLRHIIDSAQIFPLCPANATRWLDLGSGGGFPGIVMAVLAKHLRSSIKITLVESDQRKAVFLRECARQLGLSVTVASCRIEELEPHGADLISVRALAALPELCGYMARHAAPDGVGIFLKGAKSDEEVSEARRLWRFQLEEFPSVTNEEARILVMKDLRHV